MTVEAVVGVALRAIVASVVLGGVLMICVTAVTRAFALTAAARHVLWTTASFAIGVMPLAGIGVSVWKGTVAARAAVHTRTAMHRTTLWVHHADAVSGAPSRPSASAPARSASADFAPAALPAPIGERIAGLRDGASRWAPRLPSAAARAAVAIWALGALIGLAGLAASIVRVRGLTRRSSPLDGTLPDELPWLTEANGGREIYLRLSYETETPVAIGLGRPVILIPTELATASGLTAIEPLILHEHAHLRRYDDWTNLAQRTIERILWFNPIVWVIGRRIALEREIASDDAVVERTGEAHAYASSLWRLVREMRMPEHAVVAPGALLTRKQISVRIEELLDANRSRRHDSPAAALVVALAAGLAVAAVATSAPAVELPAAHTVPPAHALASAHARVARHAGAATSVSRSSLSTAAASTAAAHRPSVATHASAWAPAPHARPARAAAAAAVPRAVTPAGKRVVIVRVEAPVPPAPLAAPVPPHDGSHPDVPGEHDLAVELRDALSAIPATLAQETRGIPHSVFSGVKVSREMVASCTACSLRHADLRGVDLHGLRIEGDDFNGADLRNANLAGTKLVGVILTHADLRGADLRGAELNGVELRGAVLDDAVLAGGRFTGVNFSGANLSGADLTNAVFDGCDLARATLTGAKTAGMTLRGSGLGE